MFLEHGITRLTYHNTTTTHQRIFRTRYVYLEHTCVFSKYAYNTLRFLVRYFRRDYIQKPPPDFKTLCSCSRQVYSSDKHLKRTKKTDLKSPSWYWFDLCFPHESQVRIYKYRLTIFVQSARDSAHWYDVVWFPLYALNCELVENRV